jgi:hypothetical protein
MRWPSAEEVAGSPTLSAGQALGRRKVMHGAKNACPTEGWKRGKLIYSGLRPRGHEGNPAPGSHCVTAINSDGDWLQGLKARIVRGSLMSGLKP